MALGQSKIPKSQKAKLIFNPYAGVKRRLIALTKNTTTLEQIKDLLEQYQIPVDYFPTKYPGHATKLAKEATKENYEMVLVAGGDGTVGEAANGLIGKETPLGIIPLGYFMNVARMLSRPTDLEKAVELIKIKRIRKIDVGVVSRFNGEKLEKPYYFLESAGLGLEAELYEHFLAWERGQKSAVFKMLKSLFGFFNYKVKIITNDKREIQTRATLVTISNGPYSGAAVPLSPKAKLNDHFLTLSIFRMSKFELIRYILRAIYKGRSFSSKVEVLKVKKVKILANHKRMVHADGRVFG